MGSFIKEQETIKMKLLKDTMTKLIMNGYSPNVTYWNVENGNVTYDNNTEDAEYEIIQPKQIEDKK